MLVLQDFREIEKHTYFLISSFSGNANKGFGRTSRFSGNANKGFGRTSSFSGNQKKGIFRTSRISGNENGTLFFYFRNVKKYHKIF